MSEVGWAALTALAHLAVVGAILAPLIWWQGRRSGHPVLAPGGARTLATVAGIYLAMNCVLTLPRVGFFADLSWNWQNKLLLVALTALAITLWPSLTWRAVGARRPRRGWWMPVVGAFAVMLGLNMLGGPQITTDAETFLFQALVPGLDEELLYRGVLLLLLHRALAARRTMWRGTAGWEVPITCLLFGLAHGLYLSTGWAIALDVPSILVSGLLGLVLVWVRIRWDSLWPAVLTHNAINVAAVLANTI